MGLIRAVSSGEACFSPILAAWQEVMSCNYRKDFETLAEIGKFFPNSEAAGHPRFAS
jgi:hypothetical protein